MIWKDRIKQYPHRYTLTNVSGSTYDFTEVTGEVTEAGTPVNAENLNKLIQRDGDDIKDTVTTFTEAGTRANIGTGESTATLFGKIKKYFTDLKTHAFTNPSTSQSTSADTVPSSKLLNESTYSAVYLSLTDYRLAGITSSSTVANIVDAMNNNSILVANMSGYTNLLPDGETDTNMKVHIEKTSVYRVSLFLHYQSSQAKPSSWWATYRVDSGFSGWKKNLTTDQISTVMPISSAAASNEKVLGEKVVYDEFATKSYADSIPAYDKIIRTQAEFNELINSPNWLGATSVALVGQFTYSEAFNSGIKVPATVKQIHGFNSAKITVTNFLFNPSTSNGGLWYDTLPTTLDYSIRDLEVDCTGGGAVEFGFGFRRCSNLTNCTGTGRGAGAPGYGFYNCTNLTNCTGTGTTSYGDGFGFYDITYASNCKDGGSTYNMWGGTNKNIDVDTCRKTPVAADNTTLNT